LLSILFIICWFVSKDDNQPNNGENNEAEKDKDIEGEKTEEEVKKENESIANVLSFLPLSESTVNAITQNEFIMKLIKKVRNK
jgi:hypothetical protein